MSQQHDALQIANRVRTGGVVVRQELRVGKLTMAEALDDTRASHLTIESVLCAPLWCGPCKAGKVLRPLHIWPTRRVRDLTARQKALIVEMVAEGDARRERRAA